jgi:hypothetical protein
LSQRITAATTATWMTIVRVRTLPKLHPAMKSLHPSDHMESFYAQLAGTGGERGAEERIQKPEFRIQNAEVRSEKSDDPQAFILRRSSCLLCSCHSS